MAITAIYRSLGVLLERSAVVSSALPDGQTAARLRRLPLHHLLPGTRLRSPVERAPDDLVDLVRRCARGDIGALRSLYESQGAFLLAVAMRMIRNRPLAEEVVQDAFVQIWRGADRFDPAQGTARGWMVGVVRYRALDLLDKEARRPRIADLDLPAIEAAMAALPSAGPSAEDQYTLGRCLGELQVGPRHAIALAFIDGCSHTEVAETLGEPLGTVKTWIRRGLAALKRCMEG